MGSSSSKPQYYYPYPQTGQPIQGGYPYAQTPQPQGQFGYYIQQVGSEPNQVQAIPGYYYHPGQQRVRNRAHKRHNSAPMLVNPTYSQSQQREKEAVAASSEQPAVSSTTAEPVTESAPSTAVPPEAPAEAAADTAVPNDTALQPPASVASAPEPTQPELTNPLPSLPRDVLETDPYRHLRRTQTSGSTSMWGNYAAPIASVSYKPHLRSQYRSTGKEPMLRPPRPHEELIPKNKRPTGSGRGAFKLLRSLTMPSFTGNKRKQSPRSPVPPHGVDYPYVYATSASRGPIPAFSPVPVDPPIPAGPPITIPLRSPLNPTSLHKILYKKKLYPTAAHLFEAQKFLKHRPELAERIRTSSDNAAEMSVLSRAFQMDGMVRPDWELVWRDKMDEVLYMKFVQHPDLRAELMATGYSPLLDGNEIRQPDAEGVNELGKALVRLRERLRREGAR